MSAAPPRCRTITVFAFRGDRSQAFVKRYLQALQDEMNGIGPGPTPQDCLLYAGHTGVSIDEGARIWGSNPHAPNLSAAQMMSDLRNSLAFPGIVRDDTAIFVSAKGRPTIFVQFDIIFPDPHFQAFKTRLDAERKQSQYLYGFPNGDGDCNCTTWLERLGLPLLTGRMSEFVALWGIHQYPTRRFGKCI